MRIIVNAISANTGGIVTYTTNLIEYIGAEDLEVIIYVPNSFDPDSFTKRDNIKVIPVGTRFFGPVHRFLWEQMTWRNIVKRSGADLVFSSANYGILLPPIPQVLLVQGEIYLNPVYIERVLPTLSVRERLSAFLRRHLMLLSARNSRQVVFPSKVARRAAEAFDARLSENATVNYLGVNPRFSENVAARNWRQDGTIRLLYVSVYYPHKDPVTLADATVKLNQMGVPARAQITVEHEDFQAWDHGSVEWSQLDRTEIRQHVDMGRIGHDELSQALGSYDAFVFPSMAETFGFPMVEAMRAGVPLVVSDIPVHREICGDAAIYFRLGDADDLAAAISRLDADPELRRRLTEMGRARAETMFTWESHVANLMKSFSKVARPAPVRVLVNALHARTGGGVTYLRNMLPMLAADPELDVHICAHASQSDVVPTGVQGVTYHLPDFKHGFWRVLFYEQSELPSLARRIGAHVTFSPANYGPLLAPRLVVMLRNAVSVGFVERRPMKLAYWALLYLATLASVATCRRAIAVSEFAKQMGTRPFFGRFRDRVAIVPHGVDEKFSASRADDTAERFLLSVSDIYVQKNFDNLVHAFARVHKAAPVLKLKIAGRPIDADYFESLNSLIRQMGLQDHVEFLGHVHPNDLRDLYRNCEIFVFPSTVETFGNPLVEAMASGCVIASSNTAAMPEVLGDAGVYFDPNDVVQMADVILGLTENPEEGRRLRQKAADRARGFSWRNTAKMTSDILKNAYWMPKHLRGRRTGFQTTVQDAKKFSTNGD